MIKRIVRLGTVILSLALIHISCSNDDELQSTKPKEDTIIDLTKIQTYHYNTSVIMQQASFIEKAVTNQGIEKFAPEWDDIIRQVQPKTVILENEIINIIFENGQTEKLPIQIIDTKVFTQKEGHDPLPVATLSDDKKELTIYSSFYHITGVDRVNNRVQNDSLQEYLPIGLHTFIKKFDHLKEIKGRYLRVAFDYTIQEKGAP